MHCQETIPQLHDYRAQLFQQLSRELQPFGVAEQLLVAEMARSAAEVEQQAVAAIAWRHWAAEAMAEFAAYCGSTSAAVNFPVQILPSDVGDRSQQQVLAHSRAFHRALQLYLKLRKRQGVCRPPSEVCQHFEDEETCQKYLVHYQLRNFACACCGARKAYFITIRRCLECAGCHIFLDEFACESAVYDDQQRTIKYVHPETQPDDTLHATNYALLIATRAHYAGQGSNPPIELV
jgi:hypothetical protein